MENLTAGEAMLLVKKIGPKLGYDFTYDPVFPKDRKDICAVRHMAEDGSDYGYDTIYLVWKDNEKIFHKEIQNSRATKDYIHINAIETEGDQVTVRYGSGGSYSGTPWEDKTTTKV